MSNENAPVVETKKTFKLSMEQKAKIRSGFYNEVNKKIVERINNVKVILSYNKIPYSLLSKAPKEIPLKEIMEIGRHIINTNSDIYNEFIFEQKRSKKIAIRLLAEQSGRFEKSNLSTEAPTPESAIKMQYSRGNFQPDVLKAMSDILGIEIKQNLLIDGSSGISEIEANENFYVALLCNASEDEIYYYEQQECIIDFLNTFITLNKTEQYFLYKNFDNLISPFLFYNRVISKFEAMSQEAQDSFNSFINIAFPEAIIEKRRNEINNNSHKELDYHIVSHLIESTKAIPENELESFSEQNVIAELIHKLENDSCFCFDWDTAFANVKLLLYDNSDNLQVALFFTTLTDNEKTLILNMLNHLNCIYQDST